MNDYHKSTANEIKAIKDRVQYLIGDSHWYSVGWYKEIVLIKSIKRFLPNSLSVGTGFVVMIEDGDPHPSNQLDVIVFDNNYPTLFSEGDFHIVTPDSVRAIIEVKSTIGSWNELEDIVRKMNDNGERIVKSQDTSRNPQRDIFNGIFAFEPNISIFDEVGKPNQKYINFRQKLFELNSYRNFDEKGQINFITMGNIFLRIHGMSKNWNDREYLAVYNLPDLSVAYFISNLLDHTAIRNYSKVHFYSVDKEGESYFLFRMPLYSHISKRIIDYVGNNTLRIEELVDYFNSWEGENELGSRLVIEMIEKFKRSGELWSPLPSFIQTIPEKLRQIFSIREIRNELRSIYGEKFTKTPELIFQILTEKYIGLCRDGIQFDDLLQIIEGNLESQLEREGVDAR